MAAACILYEQRLKSGSERGRWCERCRGELGRIINRGACCPGCRQRVCKSCRHFGLSSSWLCTLCYRTLCARRDRGDWSVAFAGSDESTLNAVEHVRKSLQRSMTFSDRSESAWSFVRGSAEMRAYSSLPRHQDCEFLAAFVFRQKNNKFYQSSLKDLSQPPFARDDSFIPRDLNGSFEKIHQPVIQRNCSEDGLDERTNCKNVLSNITENAAPIYDKTKQNIKQKIFNLSSNQKSDVINPSKEKSRSSETIHKPSDLETTNNCSNKSLESLDNSTQSEVKCQRPGRKKRRRRSGRSASMDNVTMVGNKLEDSPKDKVTRNSISNISISKINNDVELKSASSTSDVKDDSKSSESINNSSLDPSISYELTIKNNKEKDGQNKLIEELSLSKTDKNELDIITKNDIGERVPGIVIKEMTVSIKRSDSFKTFVEHIKVKKECKINRERRKSADSIGSGHEIQIKPIKDVDRTEPAELKTKCEASPKQETRTNKETTEVVEVNREQDKSNENKVPSVVENTVNKEMISNTTQDEIPTDLSISHLKETSIEEEMIHSKSEDTGVEEITKTEMCVVSTSPKVDESSVSVTIPDVVNPVERETSSIVSEVVSVGNLSENHSEGATQTSDREASAEGTSSMDSSPCLDKRSAVRSLHRGHPAFARAREKRISETSNFPPGVSPEGLRRSMSLEEGEDLRLVFISSDSESDGSEQLLEWDYFESKPLGGAVLSQPFSARPVALPFGRLLPVPFPVPVPVFVPVPWNHGMTEPVLKLYKTLGQETEDRPPYSPPGDPDPHDSLTSSSESTDDESSSRRFSSTFVVNSGSGEESDTETPVKPDSLPRSDGSPEPVVPVENGVTERGDNLVPDAVPAQKDLFETTITNIEFPDREVLNVISQFIEEERKVYEDLEKVCEEAAEEVDARSPGEFSGTESMGEDGEDRPVCLLEEEGLADDDSWVEELDREEDLERDDLDQEEAVTTEEEEDEEPRHCDREEELRGYHRSAIDFTLHTIVEESCEESEVEPDHRPTELEKYFFYGIGQGISQNEADTVSETSSIYSETADDNEDDDNAADLASSRLEKYFLSDFMGFSRRDSDGSVGSDSEGKPSPGQRRKRLVRGRGSARQSSASLDNLAEAESLPGEQQSRSCESEGSDSQDEQTSFVDGQFDTVKRTKKKKRSISSAPSLELLERSDEVEEIQEDAKSPQPEGSNEGENTRSKQPSRDSGFMGSCDDLLKESRESPGDDAKAEDKPTVKPPPIIGPPPSSALSRKDSFNNWSSDEETNIMMSKMRAFFKSMVASQSKSNNNDQKTGSKPPQLAYFETELTRLMKSVPGIRDEQVKEIVEYLSSEDTWSDSYDSSDYTSSDLDTSNRKSALQQEISASCRQIISNFEKSNEEPVVSHQESSRVYQKIVSSFNRIEPPAKVSHQQSSPPLMEKVMQHIGSRLVALMHEVSGGEGSSPRHHHRRLESKLSTTSEEEEEEEEWSGLPRSKSHDPLMEESRQEASDNERFSWRGSFESALLADSRTRLTGRRSAGDLVVCEELDRVRSLDSMGGDLACPTTNSLPRLPTSPTSAQIYKAHSVASVKSARYRAPGFRPASAPPRQRRRPPPPPLGSGEDSSSEAAVTIKPHQEEEVDKLIQQRTSLGCGSDSLASVYSGAGEGRHGGVPVRGEVQFGLQYNYKLSSLEIHIKQCRDLAPIDLKRNRSDPYVKVYLLPDKSKSGKRKTRVKKHTLNPIFEETLRFQVGGVEGLESRTLWLSVWHSDMFGRNDFLGEVLMPLENKVFDDPHPKFYPLAERSEPLEELSSKGELIVGLKFVPPEEGKKRPTKGTLYVLVKEAKNLPAVKSNGTSDPFCKSYLLPDKGRGSKQKAPVVRKTINPVWNHTLTYSNVSLPELKERSLELTLWDHDRLASNEFLGGVRLSLGTGKHRGKAVDWMDSSGNEVSLWQQMSEKPNFWVESCLPLRPSLDTLRKFN